VRDSFVFTGETVGADVTDNINLTMVFSIQKVAFGDHKKVWINRFSILISSGWFMRGFLVRFVGWFVVEIDLSHFLVISFNSRAAVG